MSDRADRTRGALQRCALELFLRDGYDATTVAAISRAAGVSQMTFFRHLPTKESVVLDDPYDPVIAEWVAAQPVTLPPLERVRRGLVQAWAGVREPVGADVRARIRWWPVIPGCELECGRTRSARNGPWSTRCWPAVTRLQAIVAAAACLGALTAALLDWACDDAGQSLHERITAALNEHRPGGGA